MSTTINNPDLKRELITGAGIQTAYDSVPSQIAEKVVPVMEVNPKLLRTINIVRRASAVNSTAGTIYTTPSDKDFFLCGVSLSVIKDVTATSIRSDINGFPEGDSVRELISIATLTLTVQDSSSSLFFNIPIKMARGTNISLANSTNVGNITAVGNIYGYIVDN